jgi:hypothetical protein
LIGQALAVRIAVTWQVCGVAMAMMALDVHMYGDGPAHARAWDGYARDVAMAGRCLG